MPIRPPATSSRPADWPAVDEELLKVLPAVLRAVVKALGYARARAWLAEHGGVNVHVPARHTPTLGLEPAEHARLAHALAPHLDDNRRVWCPKADKLFQLARNAQIKADKASMSITAQARQHGLSSRHITNIRGAEQSSGQQELF